MHEITSAFLRRYAEEHNMPVDITCATDPVKGLFEATAHGDQFDLILLDIRMPKLTGDEIFNSLMQIKPELLDRVLFVTGYRQDLKGRFTDQPLRILDKPFRYAQLAEAISLILNPDAH
ncbi:MAG: response regulator [Zetaproteobacteria bacterium]|nr:MAG: response regulator [Zetaproteobacteria bacterium]